MPRLSKDPVSQALNERRKSPRIEIAEVSMAFPRRIELRPGEFDKSIKPGNSVEYEFEGTVESMHEDGTAIIRVARIGHSEDERSENQERGNQPRVTPTP